jgi:hypothetical protein
VLEKKYSFFIQLSRAKFKLAAQIIRRLPFTLTKDVSIAFSKEITPEENSLCTPFPGNSAVH